MIILELKRNHLFFKENGKVPIDFCVPPCNPEITLCCMLYAHLIVNRTKGYELEMGVNGAKEMQLEIAETSVGAGYMFPK